MLKALNNGVMDGTVTRTTVLSAMASNVLSAKDAAVLNSKLQQYDADSRHVLGAANHRAWGNILAAFHSSFFADPGKESEAREEFTAEAETAKKPSDYANIQQRILTKYGLAPVAPPGAAAIAAKLKAGIIAAGKTPGVAATPIPTSK